MKAGNYTICRRQIKLFLDLEGLNPNKKIQEKTKKTIAMTNHETEDATAENAEI